jgi:L-alanine-DL-glutamate epimerase-like enolase superfamily enzyme
MEVFPLSISFERVIEESFGTVGKREDDVVLRIHTDDGISGLGEGSTLGPFYSGESQGTVIDILCRYLFPKVLNNEDPFNLDQIHWKMDQIVYANSVAKSAVDFALHDIIARALRIPVYQMIGGKFTERIPVRFAVGIDKPEKMAACAKDAVKAGFSGIKMKAGLNPMEDVDRVAAIREAVGPKIIIDVDINGGYRVKEAIETLKKIEKLSPLLIEQPVRRDDLEGMALVRKNVDLPIGACESALSLTQILRIIKLEAADFFNYKISRSGGFFHGKHAVHAIEAAGLFAVGSEQLGFGIELAAQAHFAVSTVSLKLPGGYGAGLLGMAGSFDTRNFEGDIVEGSPRIENGHVLLPEGNGLGVTLAEDKIKRYLTPGEEPIRLGKKS